jgi:hypothetical protein
VILIRYESIAARRGDEIIGSVVMISATFFQSSNSDHTSMIVRDHT